MPISSTDVRTSFTGNGITTVFSVAWSFFDATDIAAYTVDASTGVETYLVNGTDFEVTGGGGSGGSVEFATAPTAGTTVVIERAAPYTQGARFIDAEPFSGAANGIAMDRLALQMQQVYDLSSRALKVRADQADVDADTEYDLPTPVSGQVLVGKSDATGWENRAVATLSGTPLTTPVALAQGGTGATTAANARTALGLGTAATYATGTTSGTIPLLTTGGKLQASVVPSLSSSVAGALPAYSTVVNGLYVAGTGWQTSTLVVPLKEVAVGTAIDTIDVMASGTEWDAYDEFLFELLLFADTANSGFRMKFNISGTVRASSEYGYVVAAFTPSAEAGAGSSPSSPSDDIRWYGTADGIGPNTAAQILLTTGRVKNLNLIDSSYPPVMLCESQFMRASGATTYTSICNARPTVHVGKWRGFRINTEDSALIAAGSRARIWGVSQGTFS